jgi:arylmalonate decarboxylase
MGKAVTIGIIVPWADDRVPADGPLMYPEVTWVPKGVGVQSLTPEGYDPAMKAILPAAEELAGKGVDAVMVMGTSLTFYKGAAVHRRLMDDMARVTGLPVGTMSQAVVDGLRAFGAKEIAVATAYNDVVNDRLRTFLTEEGFEVRALKGFGISEFGGPAGRKSEREIIDLGVEVCDEATGSGTRPEGLLVSCGGLRTLGVAAPIEAEQGVPVVSSTPAAFRHAVRLAGHDGRYPGYGRLLAMG